MPRQRNKAREAALLSQLGGQPRTGAPIEANASGRGRAPGLAPNRNEPGALEALLRGGRMAVATGGTERADGTFVRNPLMPKVAGSPGRLYLADELPDLIGEDGRAIRTPAMRDGGERVTIREMATHASRVIAAGAHLVPIRELEPRAPSGVPVLEEVPNGLTIVGPSPFGPGTPIGGENEIAATPLPWSTAELDRATTSQVAWRCEIGRREGKTRGDEELAALLYHAVTLGLAQAVDVELLAALIAANPAPWSVGSAAAKGVRLEELAAVVGTNGAGVSGLTPGAEALLVGGVVPGELTDAIAETIVAAWSRMAVAVQDEVEVLVERRDASGKLIVTAWFNLQALIPDTGFAWAAA